MKSMRLIWGSTLQTFIKCSLFSKITGVKMSKVCNLRRFFNLLGGPRSFDLNSVKRFYTTMVVTGASLCCLFSAGLCSWCCYVVWYCACVLCACVWYCACVGVSLSLMFGGAAKLLPTPSLCLPLTVHAPSVLFTLLLLTFFTSSSFSVRTNTSKWWPSNLLSGSLVIISFTTLEALSSFSLLFSYLSTSPKMDSESNIIPLIKTETHLIIIVIIINIIVVVITSIIVIPIIIIIISRSTGLWASSSTSSWSLVILIIIIIIISRSMGLWAARR